MQLTAEILQDWNKTAAYFRALGAMVESQPANYAQMAGQIVQLNNLFPAPVFTAAAKVFCGLGQADLYNLTGARAVLSGLALVERGDLKEAAAFFAEAAEHLPETCRAYDLLYGMLNDMTAAYRRTMVLPRAGGKRRIVIAITVWGDRYVDLFTRYFIPSILSPNNIPALREIREVHVDIYAPARYVPAIRRAPSFQRLAALTEVEFVTFSEDILTSPEYKRNPQLRHRIYGAFHHLSMEHARALDADIIPIAPDGVHSDGSFTNYARFVDQGYKAVLFTCMRGQNETLLPILDAMRDDEAHVLTLPARKLVELNLGHVHHTFKRFILTKGNDRTPPGVSLLFFPYDHGCYARVFHIHPIIIAAEVLKKDIKFDYFTVDSNALARFFPTPAEWETMKIIQHTDDGVMMDIADAGEEPTDGGEFTPRHLSAVPHYLPHHMWVFQHRIDYHCGTPIEAIGTFDRLPNGSLQRRMLPVSSRIDMTDEQLAAVVDTMHKSGVLRPQTGTNRPLAALAG